MNILIYSRALPNADFGNKKNQCITKIVYCELLYRDIKKRVSEKFLHTLYTIKSVYFEVFWNQLNPCICKIHALIMRPYCP